MRAGVYFAFAAAVALLVHPGDTGDLAFFVHTSEKLFSADWLNVFADPNVQVGPLQLALFRLGDLAGMLALLVQLGTAALLWVTAGRLLTDQRIRLTVCLVAVAIGLTYGAYQDGHPAQVVVPLLWVLAACDAREGRVVRAGVLVGLSAGFEVWGALGVVVFLLAPRVRAAMTGVATQACVSAALFLPFVVAGEFRMFDYRWRVNGDTLLSLVVEPGTDFTWSMRLLQGIAALAAGAGVALRAQAQPARGLARAAGGRRCPARARPRALPLVLARRADARAARCGRAPDEPRIRPNEASATRRNRPMREDTCREPPSQPLCFPPHCSRPRRPRTRQHPRSR